MKQQFLKLAQQIRMELNQLERSIQRSEEGWQRFQQTNDELYLDSVAGKESYIRGS